MRQAAVSHQQSHGAMLVRTALLLSLLSTAISVHGKAVTWNEAKNRSESAGLGASAHISPGGRLSPDRKNLYDTIYYQIFYFSKKAFFTAISKYKQNYSTLGTFL